jgi:hypothetical protein
MQGLTETRGTGRRHDTLPAHLSKRFYKRYVQTLLGVAVPAMMAGMAAGWMMSDTKGEVAPIHDLAQRVEMLRYAQTKTPTVLTMAEEEVRTSAVHLPVNDVSQLVR